MGSFTGGGQVGAYCSHNGYSMLRLIVADPYCSSIEAVKRDNLFFVPPELIQRHTPRLLEGTEILCRHLETVRGRRGK